MKLSIRPLGLEGVVEITPARFGDARGFFSETYNESDFRQAGIDVSFIQDNHSYSAQRGVLRGLHYQLAPWEQDKLVRVVRGAVFDVAVDIRRSSPDFGKWVGVELSADKGNQIFVPAGFAHGFVTLTDDTEVIYKVSRPYAPDHERSIRFDDSDLAIHWPVDASDISASDKDLAAPNLRQAELCE